LGRLCGCDLTKSRAVRIRQIVETAGELPCLVSQVRGDGRRAGFVAVLV
jgi:hypothetical protein